MVLWLQMLLCVCVCYKEPLCIDHPWFIVRFETLIHNITDEMRFRIAVSVEKGVQHWMETCCDCLGYYSLSCLFTQGCICSVLCIMIIKAQSHRLKTHIICVYILEETMSMTFSLACTAFFNDIITFLEYISYIWSPYLLTNGLA